MRVKDAKYLEWVRRQPCAMAGNGVCSPETHAHHPTGRKGMGTKRDDSEAYCLCATHHSQRHSLSGPFKGWTKRDVRSYEEAQSQHYRRQYLGLGGSDSLEF